MTGQTPHIKVFTPISYLDFKHFTTLSQNPITGVTEELPVGSG